jgi:F0F1-type ATP synthase assembly protein I
LNRELRLTVPAAWVRRPKCPFPIEKHPSSKKKPFDAYARYSGMAVQMGLTIFLGVWGGQKLDSLWQTAPWLSVFGSLLGVCAALYLMLKDFLRPRS